MKKGDLQHFTVSVFFSKNEATLIFKSFLHFIDGAYFNFHNEFPPNFLVSNNIRESYGFGSISPELKSL